MTKRNISPKSLKNLYQSNQEANQITRESIETALLHLMEKKDLPQISISELVKKAGVSRNAFYRNYKSKEEILELAYERASQHWMDQGPEKRGPSNFQRLSPPPERKSVRQSSPGQSRPMVEG